MAETQNHNPDALLADIKAEEAAGQARLKIFLGMCPGVGKTYAMLTAGHQLLREDINVAIGVVETHGRSEVAGLLDGLPSVPLRCLTYQGIVLRELDLDAVIERRPQVVLVDELAHNNAPGSRHPKRYQDVLELLAAGISVYSTLNVQHVESRADVVRQITGVTVQETVPDSVLDRADEIQLIDLTPEELRQRLKEGKVYTGERAQLAAANFFQHRHLAALRELALRAVAEHSDQDMRQEMRARQIAGPWKSSERLLVAIGGKPGGESLIRWTRRMAGALDCPWMAAHVEGETEIDSNTKAQVTRQLTLARQLGGEVMVTSGDKVSRALLRLAGEHNVTQIIVGKPPLAGGWLEWLKARRFIAQLVRQSGPIDIYVVEPEKGAMAGTRSDPSKGTPFVPRDYALAGFAVAAVTGLSLLLEPITGYVAVALLYLLLVVMLGTRYSRGPVLAAAALSALLWNFLFIPPHFTFYIGKVHDAMMFAMFFVVALAMGHLTGRLRLSELAERRRERRTAALYELAHQAAFAPELDAGLGAAVKHIESIFAAKAALLLRLPDHTLAKEAHPISSFALTEKEQSVAAWAFSRRQPAGRFTDTLPDSEALHLPLQARTAVMGVLSILPRRDHVFDVSERELLDAFAVLIGLLLEKDHIAAAIKHAEILEASERLHRSLFDSVSHELKTPLAAVETGLAALEQPTLKPPSRELAIAEVKSALGRLNRVIDNLLDMSRIESGTLRAHLEWTDAEEVIESAIDLAGDHLAQHQVVVAGAAGLPMVKIDHALLEQALRNLLVNAAQCSPAGTTVTVGAVLRPERTLVIRVTDEGPGIAAADLSHVFEKFYRGGQARPGGTGLGLSIVDGFVRAQRGTVTVANRSGSGTEFEIRLPVEILDDTQLEKSA